MEKRWKKPVVLVLLSVIVLAVACFCVWKFVLPDTEQEIDAVPASAMKDGNAARIVLKQDGSKISGAGASVSGNKIIISQGGSYYITGTLEEGQVYIDAGNSETVTLLLAGADIRNSSEAAVYVENAGYTSIFLEEGTKNQLQSGEAVEITALEDNSAEGAALYACDDLNITGTGSLLVRGYINNGIHTKNNLVINNGNISVEAVNNGLKGKDSVTISGGDITIISGGDGIKSDDTTGEGYGIISIEGGVFKIESKGDAIQAETSLGISGGNFTITSGEGSENATHTEEKGWGRPDSGWDMEDETGTSMKSFKSGNSMEISDGTFSVDAQDDAFHSNGSVIISGGIFEIATGDDGIHADTELSIEKGDINITKSYEGIESNKILIKGGNINIVSSDDGVNANGGQDIHGFGGHGGMAGRLPLKTSTKTTEETPELCITDGNIYICADGDGLDSNGNISIEGGTIVVDGPSDGRNGAIDIGSESGGICKISGGVIIAIGSSGMAETFDGSSEQYSFQHNFETSFEQGDEINIINTNGDVLYSHKAAKSGESVVFSSPKLKAGETYILEAGSQKVEITLDSVSTISGNQGGGRMMWRGH